MHNLRKRTLSRKTQWADQPDLFSWQPSRVFNSTPVAVLKLAQRFGLTIPHAIAVARLAGLGGSEMRQ
jgi:hypothetical protein